MTQLTDIRFIIEKWLTIGAKQVQFGMEICVSNHTDKFYIECCLKDDGYKPDGSVKLGGTCC
jgi:hypothetical protein